MLLSESEDQDGRLKLQTATSCKVRNKGIKVQLPKLGNRILIDQCPGAAL